MIENLPEDIVYLIVAEITQFLDSVAFSHGTMGKWLCLHFNKHFINNPLFLKSIVAVAKSLFSGVAL